ncbi:MAG: periplasmic heavy metal sensor [Desulfarculaceae bacterium]|nr:periplasmic heavy metal sensor [Desulfarculaceae bacterium]
MKKISVIAGSLTLVALMAVGAWAGPWGSGQGYGPGNCPGYAAGGRGSGPGYGAGAQMSKQDFEKFQAKRAAFLKDTMQLRQTMALKGIELRTEYAQATPDAAKIKALQTEMIDLRAQMAKKATNAGLPAYGFGGRGKGRGFGPRGGGYGPGMMGRGYGPGQGYGQGSCWR